jgi:hypothetical protein
MLGRLLNCQAQRKIAAPLTYGYRPKRCTGPAQRPRIFAHRKCCLRIKYQSHPASPFGCPPTRNLRARSESGSNGASRSRNSEASSRNVCITTRSTSERYDSGAGDRRTVTSSSNQDWPGELGGCIMNRLQRIPLVLYCLLVVYCCVWVPWHIVPPADPAIRTGYGWLWAGPLPPTPDASAYSDLPSGSKVLRPTSDANGPLSSPDIPIVGFRLLAVTALAGAVSLAVPRQH